MKARTLLAILLALESAALAARAQDSVSLRRTARVEPGRALLVRDIAAVSGPQAERLGELVLASDPAAEPTDGAGWFAIEPGRVRAVLEGELAEKAGMVALSGERCSVRVVTPAAPRSATERPAEPASPDASALVTLPTVRGAVARELCRILGADPEAMRLRFEERDAGFLDSAIEGHVLEIVPTGTSDRMPVAVTMHGPAGRMVRRTVRVELELRRTVAVATRVVERGRVIEAADLTGEEHWLAPGATLISPDEAVGSVARRRVKPGERLERQAVEPPVVIRRGDRVWVRVVTGTLVMRREAHALEDGREGERIEFAAALDSRQRFRAVVTGRGEAAILWGATGGTGLAISTVVE